MSENLETKKYIKVSDEFVEIYRELNVYNKEDDIRLLSDRERYLLLVLSLYRHDENDTTVLNNIRPFKDECMEINKLMMDKVSTNEILINLVEETGDNYINTDFILDRFGEEMPEPLGINEVRDLKINKIIE